MAVTKQEPKSYKIEYKDDAGSTHTSTYQPGSEAEKKLLRKLDMRIVPVIWVLYFLSYLVRFPLKIIRQAPNLTAYVYRT